MKKQFLEEINEIFKKYNASYREIDNYDGDDNYVGTTECIVVNGEIFTIKELFHDDE